MQAKKIVILHAEYMAPSVIKKTIKNYIRIRDNHNNPAIYSFIIVICDLIAKSINATLISFVDFPDGNLPAERLEEVPRVFAYIEVGGLQKMYLLAARKELSRPLAHACIASSLNFAHFSPVLYANHQSLSMFLTFGKIVDEWTWICLAFSILMVSLL